MRKNKNRNITILSILVVFIGIGFAYLSTNLSINGQSLFKKVEWDIYLDNIVEIVDSTNSGTATVNQDKDTINFSASLNTPGDVYGFTFDVVNDGTVDAYLESVDLDDSDLPDFMVVNIEYSDGQNITQTNGDLKGDILSRQNTEKIAVALMYKEDIDVDDLPTVAGTTNISISLNYAQYKRSDNALLKVYYNHNSARTPSYYFPQPEVTNDGTIVQQYNSVTDNYDVLITPSNDYAEFEIGTLRGTGNHPDFYPGYNISYLGVSEADKLASYKDYYEQPVNDKVEIIYKYVDEDGILREILPINEQMVISTPNKNITAYIRILNGNGNTYTITNFYITHIDIIKDEIDNGPSEIYSSYDLGGACEVHTATGWYTSLELTSEVTSLKGIKNNQILYADTEVESVC